MDGIIASFNIVDLLNTSRSEGVCVGCILGYIYGSVCSCTHCAQDLMDQRVGLNWLCKLLCFVFLPVIAII